MVDRRIVVTALTVAACGAAAATPASAQRAQADVVSVYDVRFDGNVTYQHRRVYDAEHFEDESTSFRVTVRGRALTFRNRAVTRPLDSPDIELSIPRTTTHKATDDGPVDCRGRGAATTAGFAHVGPSDPFSRGEGLLIFVPFTGVGIAMTCTGPDVSPGERFELALDNGWTPEIPGKSAARPPAFGWVFSPFATKEPDPASLRVPIDRTAPAKACPNRDSAYTRSCTARLQGTLALTRTGGTPLPARGDGGRAVARRRPTSRRRGRTPPRSRRRGRKG